MTKMNVYRIQRISIDRCVLKRYNYLLYDEEIWMIRKLLQILRGGCDKI